MRVPNGARFMQQSCGIWGLLSMLRGESVGLSLILKVSPVFRLCRQIALLLLVSAALFAQGNGAAALPDTFENVDRIVAIGDVHGDLTEFLALLRTAKLVDSKNNWTAGKTHLVLTGDFVDRGS